MAVDGTVVSKRHEKLVAEYQPHGDRHEKMAPFIAPSRVGITSGIAQGDKQTHGVYDSTSMMAAELMAHFIAGNVFNPGQLWLSWAMRRDVDKKLDSVEEWLEENRDLTLKRAAASAFYSEGPEALIDWGGFGTGCLLIEENPQPVNTIIKGFRGFLCTAVKTGRFFIAEGPDGRVDTLHREWQVSARTIRDRWFEGKTSDRTPQNVKGALDRGELDRTFKVIHAIQPRPRAEQNGGYSAAGMPWASCWVEHESKTVIQEGGYRVFPAAVPRYHRTPGEVYGRGRGDVAFPDTWTLNSAKRMGFEDWALKIRPPMLHGHNTVIGSLRLVPGGPTAVNLHGKDIRQQIMPFETGSRPEVSQIKEEELRASIQKIFYIDHILELMKVEKSEMTAYEFHKKLELLFQLLGPVYGRAHWELLYCIADIMWDLQYYAKAFPEPPPEIYDTDGQIDAVFQNPLAKAQRSGDAEAVTMALGDGAGLVQIFGPSVLDGLDPDKTMNGIMEIRGVPARWRRSDKEILALREARDAQNQQQLALDKAEQAAGAIGKAGPGMKAMKESGVAMPAGAGAMPNV